MKKLFLTIFSFLIFLGIILNTEFFRGLQTASIAKEYCSCYFVTGQSSEYCHEISSHFLHNLRTFSLDINLNLEAKLVKASIGSTAHAFGFINDRLGCKYFPSKPN